MTRIECVAHTQLWLFIPFLIGSIILGYLIAKYNELGLKDTLLAIAGLRRVKRTAVINLTHAAVLLVPLVLVMWRMGVCDPTLFGA